MEPIEYLKKILEKQEVKQDSPEVKAMQAEREKIENILGQAFKGAKKIVRYGGSYIKKTMIQESFDLDVLVYFESEENGAGESLKEIYDNVAKALQNEYFIHKKTSAIRLLKKDQTKLGINFNIDVVPGRFIGDDKTEVYLHQENSEKVRLKTNPDIHIQYIRDSEVRDAIKLLKLWKIQYGLVTAKTFILELLIVKILKNHKNKSLDKQLEFFWGEIASNIENITIEDPANPTGNDLSLLFQQAKSNLRQAASDSKNKIDNQGWSVIFGHLDSKSDQINKKIQIVASTPVSKPKPWCKI